MALKPITELGPSNPIYPFMLLSQYRILVCQKCQHACLANEVATHLAKKHPGIEPGTRRRLVDDAKVIPNVLQSRVELLYKGPSESRRVVYFSFVPTLSPSDVFPNSHP
jgi:hypothetical protein